MTWLLDHWWIANVIPYFALNGFILRSIEPGRGEWGFKITTMLIGAWLMLCIVGVMALEDFLTKLVRLGRMQGLSRLPSIPRSVPWRPVLSRLLLSGLIFIGSVALLLLLFIVLIASTGYHPTRVEITIFLIAVGALGGYIFTVIQNHHKEP